MNAAGLPSGGASGATNTAGFLIKGEAKAADNIKSRSALPLDRNKAGLPELIIDPKNEKQGTSRVVTKAYCAGAAEPGSMPCNACMSSG